MEMNQTTRRNEAVSLTMQMNLHTIFLYTLIASSLFLSPVICQNCSMQVWAYQSLGICENLEPPNSRGELFADGECHTINVLSSNSPSDISFLPGTYRAMCSYDGTMLHFFESGCVYGNCSSLTVGADQCQMNTTSQSSMYARAATPEFPVQKLEDASASGLFKCIGLSGGKNLNLSFAIFGDCSNPGCPRMESSAPVPMPTTAPSSNRYSNTTLEPTVNQGTLEPTLPLRVESASVAMALAVVEGPLSEDAVNQWKAVTELRIHRSALDEGYDIDKVITKPITQEYLNADNLVISSNSIASLAPRNETRWLQSTYNSETKSLRIYFDVIISFPAETPLNVTAPLVFREAFDTEQERTQYIVELVTTGEQDFSNLTKVDIIRDGYSSYAPTVTAPNPSLAPISNNKNPTTSIPVESNSGIPSMGLVIGLSVAFAVAICTCGYLLYRRGKNDAMSMVKEEVPTNTSSNMSPTSTIQSHFQHLPQQQWTNEIIVDPSNDDVSTLGGATFADLPIMAGNGETGKIVKIEEDEYTASVNVDYDFVKNRFRTGALNEDATVDDGGTRSIFSGQTKSSQYTSMSKLGLNLPPESGMSGVGSVCFADDRSFERQYDTDEEDNYEKHDDFEIAADTMLMQNSTNGMRSTPPRSDNWDVNNQTITPSSSMPNGPFEISVPPGVLGMVVDTPNSITPVVRAIKSTSVLLHTGVQIGDRLLSVDHIDVTKMPSKQVSNLISTRSHLHRTLVFMRPATSNTESGSGSGRTGAAIPTTPSQ